MRHKNAQFASAVKTGKKATKPSRQEQLSKRSPVSLWALGIVLFVVVGGGEYPGNLIVLIVSDL